MRILTSQLFNFSKKAFDLTAENTSFSTQQGPLYSDVNAFHVYADLDMPLAISAGETQAADRNLKILQAFASAGDATFTGSGMAILECQGQRLHFIFESDEPTMDFDALMGTSKLFYKIAKREVANYAGKIPFTIRMAGDYGRALLLRSIGEDPSESIVSLGNPANRPAKLLARDVKAGGVPAGFMAFNRASLLHPDDDPKWDFCDLEREVFEKAADESLILNASNAFGESLEFAANQFTSNPQNPVTIPIRRTGMMFRADLDGFSSMVKMALSSGDQAIAALVHSFAALMQYPSSFKETLPRGVKVLCFPWAGDCANLFLECDHYSSEREHLPHTAAVSWHIPQSRFEHWRRLMGKAKWVVAVAGGDPQNNHGSILTGNVYLRKRTFHVGAGWSWGRSSTAEQSKGNLAGDTVIQIEDYSGLDPIYSRPFTDHSEHPALYKKATLDGLTNNSQRNSQSAAVSTPTINPKTSHVVAASRPYLKQ